MVDILQIFKEEKVDEILLLHDVIITCDAFRYTQELQNQTIMSVVSGFRLDEQFVKANHLKFMFFSLLSAGFGFRNKQRRNLTLRIISLSCLF